MLLALDTATSRALSTYVHASTRTRGVVRVPAFRDAGRLRSRGARAHRNERRRSSATTDDFTHSPTDTRATFPRLRDRRLKRSRLDPTTVWTRGLHRVEQRPEERKHPRRSSTRAGRSTGGRPSSAGAAGGRAGRGCGFGTGRRCRSCKEQAEAARAAPSDRDRPGGIRVQPAAAGERYSKLGEIAETGDRSTKVVWKLPTPGGSPGL
jgi:hypothetical protein